MRNLAMLALLSNLLATLRSALLTRADLATTTRTSASTRPMTSRAKTSAKGMSPNLPAQPGLAGDE
jgi:hypothetical protein